MGSFSEFQDFYFYLCVALALSLALKKFFYRRLRNEGWCRTCVKNDNKDIPENCDHTEDLANDNKLVNNIKKAQV